MNRLRTLFVALPAVLLTVAFSSCTVKEERGVCPTYVRICSDEAPAPGTSAVVTVFHEEDGLVYQMVVPAESLYPDGYTVKARRGRISANVLMGIRSMTVFGGVAQAGKGVQPDSLYRFSGSVESWDEDCDITGSPMKEFSVLTININNTDEPFLFRLNGVWDRLDAADFRPGRGNLEFSLNEGFLTAGSYRCILSRQGDESLSMDVFASSDLETPYRTLPLGKLMTRAGYDIDAVPMVDVSVDIDLTQGVISITVGDWERVVFSVYTI